MGPPDVTSDDGAIDDHELPYPQRQEHDPEVPQDDAIKPQREEQGKCQQATVD